MNPKQLFICFAPIIFFLLWIYFPWLSGERDFFASDLTYIYEPVCSYLGQSLKEGRLPLWNPYSYCGMPQIAIISPGLFYPFTYLMAFMPFSQGEAIYLVLHQILIAAGSFLYIKKLGISKYAATLGAYCAAFCGYMFAMQKFPDYVAATAWLPLALYAAACTGAPSKHKIFFNILLAFSTSMLIYAGRPEIFLPALALIGIQTLSSTISNSGKRIMPIVSNLMVVASAVLIAGIIILPASEWLKLSPRAEGLSTSQTFIWSANWFDWFSMIFFEPFGDLVQRFGPESDTFLAFINKNSGRFPLLPPVFIGPAFVTAAAFGALDRAFKQRWFFIISAIILGLLAAGDQTPFAPILSSLFPQAQFLRYPVKLLIFPVLAGIVLAARGIDIVMHSEKSLGKLYAAGAIWAVFLFAGVSLAIAPDIILCLKTIGIANGITFSDADLQLARSSLSFSLVASSLCGLAFCLVAGLRQNKLLNERLALLGIGCTLVGPMLAYGLESQAHSAGAGFYKKPQIVRSALNKLAGPGCDSTKNGRVLYINLEPISIPNSYFENKNGSKAELYHQYMRDVMYPNAHFNTNWTYSNGYVLAETAQIINLYRTAVEVSSAAVQIKPTVSDFPLSRFCSLTNTNYIVTRKWAKFASLAEPLDNRLFTLVADDDRLNIRIYQNKLKTSRFFMARQISTVHSWKAWQKLIGMMTVPLLFDDNLTFIQENDADALSGYSFNDMTKDSTNIKIIENKPELIKLNVAATKVELLVARDQYYPGWNAEIDGKPVAIIKANLFNRAIVIPPGKHEITFRYTPQSLADGLKLAGLGLFVLIAACLLISTDRLHKTD